MLQLQGTVGPKLVVHLSPKWLIGHKINCKEQNTSHERMNYWCQRLGKHRLCPEWWFLQLPHLPMDLT